LVGANMRPIIGITMGDASGVGPEIIAKALTAKSIYGICRPLVIGDADVMDGAIEVANARLKINSIKSVSGGKYVYGTMDILDLNNIRMDCLKIGQVDEMAGKAAIEYVKKATKLALKRDVHAIVTAPINKEAVNKAGYKFTGHTELLAKLTGTKHVAMMLVAGPLRVVHVTTHVSLREACDLIRKERVLATIKLAHKAMQSMGIKEPRIAVAGLNPHAGEGGLFGMEEINEIKPAVSAARNFRINAVGPIPPDTVFTRAKKGEFDIVVAMYHDQGHIPAKLSAFPGGVNVTIGLPIVRVSVDHGTAFDIAWKGIASPQSLIEAIALASKIASTER